MSGYKSARSRPLWVGLLLLTLLAGGCASSGSASSTPGPTTAPAQTNPPSPASSATQAPTQSAGAAPAEEATAASTNTAAAPATQPAAPTATTALTPTTALTATTATTPTGAAPAATSAPASTATAATSASKPDLPTLKIDVASVAQGFSNPLFVTHAGDGSGRLFVVEKTGGIRIMEGGKVLDKPFLDISDRVGSSGSEQGLLGLAFPPDYANRKFFFVDYTNTNGDTVVGRFNVTADPNIADPNSEFKVLGLDQPAANHNGGDLVFGPDGYLWIGTGDGGGAGDQFGNGQNPGTLLAKMLRIDVTSDPSKPYVIPQDNPGTVGQAKVLPEVWAMGLRNPWRYSFDRATKDLWIGDVGQNQIEEVDVVRAGSKGGLNFGWSIMEGPSCFRAANCDQTGLVLPVASYQHGADGCSITGGFVYRGKKFPALRGVYLYGDYCSGRIWGLDAANPGQPKLLLEVGAGLSSFGEDQAGEVYITDLSNGTVRQIVVP